jgi:hypothetical protein
MTTKMEVPIIADEVHPASSAARRTVPRSHPHPYRHLGPRSARASKAQLRKFVLPKLPFQPPMGQTRTPRGFSGSPARAAPHTSRP